MTLYKKNGTTNLDEDLFKNPASEYRGAPFWAWNCKLDKEMLLKQIIYFKEMGMGGFHIHARTGLDTPYLGDEFLQLVSDCNEKAKELEMLCWLYDEDRCPSGTCGGQVTHNPAYVQKYLLFTPERQESCERDYNSYKNKIEAGQFPEGYFLSAYKIQMTDDDTLSCYERTVEEAEGERVWYAYLCLGPSRPNCNNYPYVDTLNKAAVEEFIQTTYDKYAGVLADDFGGSVPAIFTDEPQFYGDEHFSREHFNTPQERAPVSVAFTERLVDTYKEVYGYDLLDFLPELFWELPENKVSPVRYHYHNHIADIFASSYCDTLGQWCEEHNILLTGHMIAESTLASQTGKVGEAMRSYRSMGLPGIDMLCNAVELTTAKQAQSAAHQYGREGVLSELYGVTNWDFDFKSHMFQGNWQAALGVTTRVHHLTWVSMAGEAKRDFPACIGYQSPWFKKYKAVEDHFSRLNTALTRGKPHVRIGVIHPIESYWLYYGTESQTGLIREELEARFEQCTNWLLLNLLDFDFISEALLPELHQEKDSSTFMVGAMSYDVIVIPGNQTLRTSTVQALEHFAGYGGRIIFMGRPACYVEAVESDCVAKLSEKCICIDFSKSALLRELEPFREIDMTLQSGRRSPNLIYQMRDDKTCRWLFVAHAELSEKYFRNWRGAYVESETTEDYQLAVHGIYQVSIYNSMDGSTLPLNAKYKKNTTRIALQLYAYDSILLRFDPVKEDLALNSSASFCNNNAMVLSQRIRLPEYCEISLSEPNVLLLDVADCLCDGVPFIQEEEILRIDTALRQKFDMLSRVNDIIQPYTMANVPWDEHQISLQYKINTDINIEGAHLALESPDECRIFLNELEIPSIADGWFVDECIKKVPIPMIPKGQNHLEILRGFNVKTNLEACYLLGDFGVSLNGRYAKCTSGVPSAAYGDLTGQGFPFYAGNVTYRFNMELSQGSYCLQPFEFSAPLLSVSMDGRLLKDVFIPPYKLNFTVEESGSHCFEITVYGNRYNCFAAVHNTMKSFKWYGTIAWRTEENAFSYQYRLKPFGILSTPNLWKI